MNVEAPVSDSDHHNRNQILVVAGLVAAASYQAAMNPPDALKKEGSVGSLVVFFCACTLAWSFSSTLILAIAYHLPYRREISLAFGAMGFSFGYAVGAQTSDDARLAATILFIVCSLIPPLIRGGLSCCKCT